MGFASASLGFNEPTLTSLAYICYLLAFLCYSTHLLTKGSSVVAVSRRGSRLAGAGAGGGEVDVAISDDAERPPFSTSILFGRAGAGLLFLAWASLTAAIILRWIEIGHYPTVTLYEITTMLVWGTTTISLILFEGALRTHAPGAFVALLLFCLQSYALWFIPADLKRPVPLVPALRSYWFVIHVSIAIISYSAFATGAGAGLTLLGKQYLKGRVSSALPSSAAIEEFMFRAVAVGFPFMTLVLITGAIWANEAWTKAWSWDPKEVWALVTWLTYAAYLHVRVQRGVRGVTMAWLSLGGFVVVLITFLGVNYLVEWFGGTSMHTYAVDNNNGAPPGIGVAGVAVILFLCAMLGLALFSWLRIKFPRSKSPRKARR